MDERYDVVVIGSGFGGSVAALRATEKGYSVAVLEAGRRFTEHTLPKTSWDTKNFLWAPQLGWLGIQRMYLLKNVLVLSGAGVGGGSLVYANTLYEPLEPFYADRQWAHITDWRSELAPYYDQAKRMLGAVESPADTPADLVLRKVAERMGVGETWHPTNVGVYFGQGPGIEATDPFFGGVGPSRVGCTQCGSCMTGCRVRAKNTLDRNYLYLAEQGGAEIHPEITVTAVRPDGTGGWLVDTVRTGKRGRKRAPRTLRAGQVVFAAGALGTQRLLHTMRDQGVLPELSPRLGELTRTNSEAILGAMARNRKTDYSRGVAITSSMHPDATTHIEVVRYGKGSNAMGLLATLMTDGGGRVPRWLKWIGQVIRHPILFVRSLSVLHWSERTIIALVMQSLDNSLTVFRTKRGRLTSKQGHGEPNPTWIPAGNQAVRLMAEEIDGAPGGSISEIANIPVTAHILGGCPIGDSPGAGVIDPYHRVYGYEGLHVVDGAAVSANLGVNPSLTITAQAERALSFWPNKGEADPRPALGEPYRRIAPVPPRAPAVPEHAPAALRIVTAG